MLINTFTTIITFLMVFLIQSSQNRDGAALQTKLDELIRSSAAQNDFMGIEHLSEEEVHAFRARCSEMAKQSKSRTVRAGEQAVSKANQKAANAADRIAS